MANNLDRLVAVGIDIASPAVDGADFDGMLIFGPAPKIPPERPLPPVGVYASLAEVAAAGWSATGAAADPVGAAARIAFSQSPAPAKVLIAATREAEPSVGDVEMAIITAESFHAEAAGAEKDSPLPADLPWLQITYSRRPVSAMDVVIEKDGAAIFGKRLPLARNPKAYLQIPLGKAEAPGGDELGLEEASFAGAYRITLTGTAGIRTTTITADGALNDSGAFAQGRVSQAVEPEMQTPAETLATAYETPGWYAACAAGIDESEYRECAEWTEAHARLFGYTFLQEADPVPPKFYRSHGWCGLVHDGQKPGDAPEANRYVHVAATARGLSFPAGSETWHLQRAAAVTPSEISSALQTELQRGNSNWIDRRAGRTVTMNGKTRGGEWLDVIRGRDWLQNDMQLRIFNLLLVNPKIPFTNQGIAMVENAMLASLKAAQGRGIVAPDGHGEDGARAPGFTVSVPNAMSLTSTEKASRVLRGCSFTARLAGAIHAVQVRGTLTYEVFGD